jgi:DNA-binding NarL/FixJ family response regulator
MVRVIVVARFPAVRAGLRTMLDGVDGIAVVAEMSTAALAAAEGRAPADVLVFDLEDGEEQVPDVHGPLAGMPVVLLAGGPDELVNLPAAEAPRGLLLKHATAEELAAAVLAVSRGLMVLDPAVATAALASRAAGAARGTVDHDDPAEPLTERELEVLRLLALGLPNKGIALRLGISEHTVKFHVGAILGKLRAGGRTEAVMVAARRGLLPL